MGRPVYDPNPLRVNPNPLISCRVRVGFMSRVKIANPNIVYNFDFAISLLI